jgi:hypothetical protein
MSEINLSDYDGSAMRGAIGDNTFEERDKLRRYLANRVRREIPQRWDDSKAELRELIDMLGLDPKFDPPPGVPRPQRARLRDCGPVVPPRSRRS